MGWTDKDNRAVLLQQIQAKSSPHQHHIGRWTRLPQCGHSLRTAVVKVWCNWPFWRACHWAGVESYWSLINHPSQSEKHKLQTLNVHRSLPVGEWRWKQPHTRYNCFWEHMNVNDRWWHGQHNKVKSPVVISTLERESDLEPHVQRCGYRARFARKTDKRNLVCSSVHRSVCRFQQNQTNMFLHEKTIATIVFPDSLVASTLTGDSAQFHSWRERLQCFTKLCLCVYFIATLPWHR